MEGGTGGGKNRGKNTKWKANVARKFLWLAAQGNINLTCNYMKGTRNEKEMGVGGGKRGGGTRETEGEREGSEDVDPLRQPRSVYALCTNTMAVWLCGCFSRLCTALHKTNGRANISTHKHTCTSITHCHSDKTLE